MTDHVYEDTVRELRVRQPARRRADRLGLGRRWPSKIDTRGAGTPVVVFNPLGWTALGPRRGRSRLRARRDVDGGRRDRRRAARTCPSRSSRPPATATAGSRRRGSRSWRSDVPALGYRVYPRRAGHRDQADGARDAASRGRATSSRTTCYRVTFDRATGAITSLRVKPERLGGLLGPGERRGAAARTRATSGSPITGLDGGSKIAMTTKQAVPEARRGDVQRRVQGRARDACARGPVFSEFQVAHPFDSGTFETTVRVYRGPAPDRVHDPSWSTTRSTSATRPSSRRRSQNGKSVHEIPFGAIERPHGDRVPRPELGRSRRRPARPGAAQHRPAGQRHDRRDDDALAAPRAHARAPTASAAATSRGCRPSRASNSARSGRCATPWCPTPATGARRASSATASSSTTPCSPGSRHPTPARCPPAGACSRSPRPNVVVSDLKPARGGGIALRVYEATGQATQGRGDQAPRQGRLGRRGQPARGSRCTPGGRGQCDPAGPAPVRDQDRDPPACTWTDMMGNS